MGLVDNGNTDYWIDRAEQEIFATYGERVSVARKNKSLSKFGRTTNADANVKTTVATFGSVATVNVNETFSTTNDIDRVVSSSGSDTSQTLRVEGHYYDGSNNLVFTVQDVALTGQTPAALGTALCRCTRMFVKDGTFASPSTDLVGDVYAYASSGVTVTAGVPQTSTAVKARIIAGQNQTEKCATSVSYQDYWILTQVAASMSKGGGASANVDIEVEVRGQGGVWRPLGFEISLSKGAVSSKTIEIYPHFIVPSNSDVRMIATSDTADTQVSGRITGVLASVVT